MNRNGHDSAVFFVGPEVEHTPAYAKRTLFVVGKPDLAEIEKTARENKTPHVFMGANHSFEVDPTDGTFYWRDTITALLDKGFWVTLDYPAHQHAQVLMMFTPGVWQCRTFVPLLSVRIPHIETSSPNLTVKIDDVDFNATNPGVWCMHYHEVTDSNRFTGWGEYGTDVVIGGAEVAPVIAAPVVAKQLTVHDTATVQVEDTAPVVLNDPEIGLDTESTSKLKPGNEEEAQKLVGSPTQDVVLQAYAESVPEAPTSPAPGTQKKTKATVK